MVQAGDDDDMSFVSQDEEYGDYGSAVDDGQSDNSGGSASKYSGEEGVSVHDENTAKNFETEEDKEARRKQRRIEKLDKRIKLLQKTAKKNEPKRPQKFERDPREILNKQKRTEVVVRRRMANAVIKKTTRL